MTANIFAAAQRVADAVLWEGYVLYPYQAGAPKNQLRFQFGVLVPQAFARSDGFERCRQQTECIVAASAGASADVRVRFLQSQHRAVEVARTDGFATVGEADVDGEHFVTWDEGIAQVVDISAVPLRAGTTTETPFSFSAGRTVELIDDHTRVVRTRAAISGCVRVTCAAATSGRVRLRVEIENTTPWDVHHATRGDALQCSLLAAHSMLHVRGATFVSSLDPDADAQTDVAACHNDGAFPALIGDAQARNLMLSSPIILYDFPAVAAASPGDSCDATEIDEILTLRVLTLTPEEKRRARATDPRAAAIVDRAETLPDDVLAALHAEMTEPAEDSITIRGVPVTRGSRVRLRPGTVAGRRTDAQDMFLADHTATVAGVFGDLEGEPYVGVIVDGDADSGLGTDMGRFRYFFPDEVEPL